jgi:formylglycine-generating enzyme required for sulfatase activity
MKARKQRPFGSWAVLGIVVIIAFIGCKDGSGENTGGGVAVTVHVTGVTLAPATLSLTVGGTSKTLTATVAPSNATNKHVSWSSDKPQFATVSNGPTESEPDLPPAGTVTAVAAGNATITVTTADGSKTATCAVFVTAAGPGPGPGPDPDPDVEMPEIPGMVWIKPGTFTMGSPVDEWGRDSDETPHQVTLSKGFYMSESPVMSGDYIRLTGDDPTWFLVDYDEYGEYADLFPVDGVNWYAAVEYCNLLSEDEGLKKAYTINVLETDDWGYTISAIVSCDWTADGYRLPTEAEWEYACRAGTTTAYNTGDTITLVDANFDNEDGYDLEQPIPVFFYEPNAWGLYGMHGTLEEWCWDRYGAYGSGTQTDPKGPNSGAKRVVRGGSWYDTAECVRSAARWLYDPADKYYDYYGSPYVGFRVVRNAPSGPNPKMSGIGDRSGEATMQMKMQKARDFLQGKILYERSKR